MMRAALFSIPLVTLAQIPPSEKLPPNDWKEFQDEVHRIERLKATASDKCTVIYALARTWAAGGQYREAIDTLRQAVELNVGLDPSHDHIFEKLHDTREYRELLEKVRASTPPVSHSKRAFSIAEADLIPEGIAYDPVAKQFYLGSTIKQKIIRCSAAGVCGTFVSEGLGEVLGMKVDPRTNTLWTASNSPSESGVFCFDLSASRLKEKYVLTSGRHQFNDLVISKAGDVYVTDSLDGKVYRIGRENGKLEELPLKIDGPNGIALSDDEAKLYVAGFPEGIFLFDLASKSSRPIARSSDLCLATIDGLYFHRGSLIAIQNGVMVYRVIHLQLSSGLDRIESFEILERRNPLFDAITTGTIAEGSFYYMANTQIDNASDGKIKPGAKFKPIIVLRLPL